MKPRRLTITTLTLVYAASTNDLDRSRTLDDISDYLLNRQSTRGRGLTRSGGQ
jgi:hypothetical protein